MSVDAAFQAARFAETVGILDRTAATRRLNKRELGYLARAHFELHDTRKAISTFQAMLEFGDDPVIHEQIGGCFFKLNLFAEAIVPLNRAIALDENAGDARLLLTRCLMRVGDLDEAEAQARLMVALGQNRATGEAMLDAIAGTRASDVPPRPAARWPRGIDLFDDPRDLARRFIIDRTEPPPFTITPQSRLFAFGSCFAENLAAHLRGAGLACEHVGFAEIVNSTYANRHFLEWIFDTEIGNDYHQDFEAAFPGPEKARLRDLIENADLFILTLGVAPCLFEADTGRFVFRAATDEISLERLSSRYDFRTTSVEENVVNLRRIHELLVAPNADAKLVLTVSPVPLNASFEYSSAILADCVSKSTLRVVADQFLREAAPRTYYWPSFEMVRWVGSHVMGRGYGDDDGNTRHVNEDIVRSIIELFLETHGDHTAD